MIKKEQLKTLFPTGLLSSFVLIFSIFILPLSITQGAIVNGGFEDGATVVPPPQISDAPLTGWTIQSDASNQVNGRDTTILWALAPHGGNIAAAFNSDNNATGNGASLTQTLTTNQSQTYNLSLWVANPINDTGNLNNVFSIGWGGNAPANLIALSGTNLVSLGGNQYQVKGDPNTWHQITATGLTVTGTSTDLVINARNNNWATLVDDVMVDGVPEPTSVMMLGVGAVVLGFRRRRQQKA